MVVKEVALYPRVLCYRGSVLEPESFRVTSRELRGLLLVSEMPKFFAEGIARVGAYPAIQAA